MDLKIQVGVHISVTRHWQRYVFLSSFPAVRYLGVPDDEAAGHRSAKTSAGDGAAVQPAAAHGRHASPGGPRHVPAARAAELPTTARAADPGETAGEAGQRLGELALHAVVDLELA